MFTKPMFTKPMLTKPMLTRYVYRTLVNDICIQNTDQHYMDIELEQYMLRNEKKSAEFFKQERLKRKELKKIEEKKKKIDKEWFQF